MGNLRHCRYIQFSRSTIFACLLTLQFFTCIWWIYRLNDKPPQLCPQRDISFQVPPPIISEMGREQIKPELLERIRRDWLHPPSTLAYKLLLPTDFRAKDMKSVKLLQHLVSELTLKASNGFFIESGAYDGEFLSNTLHLEMERNWTGLLVEPEPNNFANLLKKHRKAWAANVCLSMYPREQTIMMSVDIKVPSQTKAAELLSADEKRRKQGNLAQFRAHCFPLVSLVAATRSESKLPYVVDYLSLDVENAELGILQSIPWELVYIKVLSVEADLGRHQRLEDFLHSQNYTTFRQIRGPFIHDIIFVHKKHWDENRSRFELL